MRVPILVLALALGSLLLLASSAMAHTSYETDDDQYVITIGQDGEPVFTFQRTNIDLIIREHLGDGERGDEIPGLHETLTATLIAPGGEELAGELRTQHGAVGRYQFANGYTLTQPGFYHLRLVGDINGSPVDDEYLIDHNIREQSQIMFPDRGLPTPHDVVDLQERVDDLEAQLAALQAGGGAGNTDNTGEAPGPAAVLLVALVALSMVLLRSRAR